MPRRCARALFALALSAAAAAFAPACVCRGTIGGRSDGDAPTDGGPITGLLSVAVTPADLVLTVAGAVPAEADYVLTGTFVDGTTAPLSALWSLSDPALGAFAATGHLTSATDRGGVATVTALEPGSGLSATTSVTFILQNVVYGPGVPPGAETYFSGPASGDPALAPTLVYPYDQVLLPPNLSVLDFQWLGGAGNDLWRARFTNAYTDVTAYVTTASWIPAGAEWTWLAETNRGGDPVVWTVEGASTTAGSWAPAAARTLSFAEEDLLGALYYWSASGSAEGIFRYDFGVPGQAASAFYTQASNGGYCVACHALSRNGARMAFTFDGGDGPFGALEVANPAALTIDRAFGSNFQTYAPDGTSLLTTSGGVLTHRDATSGAVLSVVPTSGTSTHPDWSADGATVVYTRSGSHVTDWIIGGSSIARIGFAGGVFAGESILVGSAGENNYYPGISPDGGWVVFNRSTGDSYDDPDARVWVVPAAGGAPIDCAVLNGSGALTNSWPKWAPFVDDYQGGTLMWATFSSKRDYGIRLVGAARAQLWMAAVDPGAAAAGLDPTHPPFWLPFQDIGTQNHIAQWTEELVDGCMRDEDCGMGWVCNGGMCEPLG